MVTEEKSISSEKNKQSLADNKAHYPEFGGLKETEVGIFNKYVDKTEIAPDLIQSMVDNAYQVSRKGRRTSFVAPGFFMSDESKKVGALSICPALSTLFNELSLIKDGKQVEKELRDKRIAELNNGGEDQLSEDEFEKKLVEECDKANEEFKNRLLSKKKDGISVLKIVQNSILQIIDECFVDDQKIVFTASPYADEQTIDSKWKCNTERNIFVNGSAKEINVGGYLDTASWVFLVAQLANSFIDRLLDTKLLTEDDEWVLDGEQIGAVKETTETVKDKLEKLYIASMRHACNCVIETKAEGSDKSNTLGWSFTNINRKSGSLEKTYSEADVDIYMSYVASTIYLGLYKEYSREIEMIRRIENCLSKVYKNSDNDHKDNDKDDAIDTKLDYSIIVKNICVYEYFKCFEGELNKQQGKVCYGTIQTLIDYINSEEFKQKTKINQDESDTIIEYLNGLKINSSSDKDAIRRLEKLCYLFKTVNGGTALLPEWGKKNGKSTQRCFTYLKNASSETAKKYWEMFKVNMAKGPCFEDGTLANDDSIVRSGHSNVLFNNLFVIGLVVNSAYDASLIADGKTDEYNDMLTTFQIAVQDVQRRYDAMESDGTIYKVNSYILEFAQKNKVNANDNTALAMQLRKLNITACYLLPILLKTNGIIGDYLVRYPQRQMSESLKNIVKDRKFVDADAFGDSAKDQLWIWDKDGYNSISNYYYVDALISFYRYYEQYELPFVDQNESIEKRHNEEIASLKTEHEATLKSEIKRKEEEADKEIKECNNELTKYREIQKLIAEFVLGGLVKVLNEQMEDVFKEFSGIADKADKDSGKEDKQLYNDAKDILSKCDMGKLIGWLVNMNLLSLYNENSGIIKDYNKDIKTEKDVISKISNENSRNTINSDIINSVFAKNTNKSNNIEDDKSSNNK